MTAILGYADGKNVWIAGDSGAMNGGWQRFTVRERKVWRSGEMLIGCCGRWAVSQLLQSLFLPPEQKAGVTDIFYLYGWFIPALKAFLEEYKTPMANDETTTGLIIGYHGTLYHIDSYFNTNAIEPQLVADGAGGDLAKGAFEACRMNALSVEGSMLKALEIAGRHNLTVAPPYYVEMI